MDNIRQSSIQEKVVDSWYNFRFLLFNLFNNIDMIKDNDKIYILGQVITINPDNLEITIEEVREIIRNTIWVTYRRNFPPLCGSDYISDTGWGCMIRAGQMILGQILKKHQNINHRTNLGKIISQFADNDEDECCKFTVNYIQIEKFLKSMENKELTKFQCLYSIQKIAHLAKLQFKLNPGDWYKPNYILFILKKLHNRYGEQEQLNQNNPLKIIVFNDSSMFYDKMENTLKGIKKKKQDQQNQKKQQNGQQKQCSLAVFVLTRIGLEEPQDEYLKVLDEIMTLKQFQGLIGGSPQRALYILGRVGSNYIYLDPHYVQEGTRRNQLLINTESYSCQYLNMMNQKKVDTSMGLGFYVKDLDDLHDLWAKVFNEIQNIIQLLSIKKRNKENFFIYLSNSEPEYQNLQQQDSENQYEIDGDVIVVG